MLTRIMRFTLVVAVGLVLSIAAFFLACGDKPTEPKPVKDYPLYFWNNSGTHLLYTYYTGSGRLDSTNIAYWPWNGLEVSADGERLYVGEATSVAVLDSDSLQLITRLPYAPKDIAVSRDNQLLAICGDSLVVVDTRDYSVVYHTSHEVNPVKFSWDSESLYGAYVDPATKAHIMLRVRGLLSDSPELSLHSFPHGILFEFAPLHDESPVLVYLRYSTFGYVFEAYDLEADSAVFTRPFIPGVGRIAISPDGETAIVTNPGTLYAGPPPSQDLYIYDIQKNEIVEEVPTYHVIDDSLPPYFYPEIPLFTPDGEKLIIFIGNPRHQLLVADAATYRFRDWQVLKKNVSVSPHTITIQSQCK